jgi:aspartyl-tRNA(Asn)/glutamyl-tRNA(Gln) amidotransferase subunit A
METIKHLRGQYLLGADSASALVERNIARVNDPAGEGARAFLSLNESAARAAAAASDTRMREADSRPLDGVTIAIKDLFDVAGEVTGAGSTVLRSRPAAAADCPAVARLRDAGAIIFGRNNMVEFAFSGIGINPHFGTPRSIWGRTADGGGRVPGGSSSGGGVAVADGMAVAALGSDTGGSVRLPAAFNGVVGFKPTAYRVPVNGAIPLSFLHDSVGPIANSVECCARIDAVLANEIYHEPTPKPMKRVRLLNPLGTLWSNLDPEVELAVKRAIDRLRSAGATVVDAQCEPLENLFRDAAAPPEERIMGRVAETCDWHAANVNVDGVGYDPRVWKRIQMHADVTRAEVSQALAYLRLWKHRMQDVFTGADGFDAIISPTVACIPPHIAPLVADDALFFAKNQLILRNTSWVNLMDGCALTLPCHNPGEAPVGLQLVGRHGGDHALLSLGLSVEALLPTR